MPATEHPDSPASAEVPAVEALPAVVAHDATKRLSKGGATGSMPPHREDIPIPDLQLLRRIGSGSYGEVWLARAITGALRAVKIVWREDFEYDKTYRQEFEGIQQFEPISRGHQGLVDVLHVGWNDERDFYYYVMELGDDAERGPEIDLESYVPRTLSTDFRRHGRLNLEYCRQTGIFLADALGYLHSYGLTHRDIKPSNIIFVGGVCKLADIGLVAAHGERSFVGTEGFVPPEGPGTFAADIFSLGKVLYEISSGKDRMEFPEVPDDLQETEMNFWRDWNRVICRACAPEVQDRYANAADFANDLRMVGVPRPVPVFWKVRRVLTRLVTSGMVAGTALSMAKHERAWQITVAAPDAAKLTPDDLARLRLPQDGRLWMNGDGLRFTWREGRHVSDKPVNLELFSKFLESTLRPFEGEVVPWIQKGANTDFVVVVPKADAMAFCEWLTNEDRSVGALNDDYEYQWKAYPGVKSGGGNRPGWSSIRLELARLHFGEVLIETTPAEAEVLMNGSPAGSTPLRLTRVRVGDVGYEIHLPGFKREVIEGQVKEGMTLRFNLTLKPTLTAVFGKKWTNSIGMEFVPLGDVLISSAETRRADWAEYYRQLPSSLPPPVPLDADRKFPMTHVSRLEAEMFCQWLTNVERAKGLLETWESYRLPTDDEWSMAAGLPRERGNDPADRNDGIMGIYPWGFTWPPVPVPGNLWDTASVAGQEGKKGIPRFKDGFGELAPVRSFAAVKSLMDARAEMYDLAGNVWEWEQSNYGGKDPKLQNLGVVRGGSWRTKDQAELLASHRRAVAPETQSDDIGFRVVLSAEGERAREEIEE
ncbi:MAG: SUMF1/EgtB/PvdO family nonheme iron enzyme [Verrucomicrobia bacterium]|nr:SUMF1/EgtB/PvdO family nonheme iron enzyme [Verrucomicrobiota bacterium]